jgi:hypothetical protein
VRTQAILPSTRASRTRPARSPPSRPSSRRDIAVGIDHVGRVDPALVDVTPEVAAAVLERLVDRRVRVAQLGVLAGDADR